ncbi:LEAF RUST 10 DISEASE-RESISTANCE LOCUS RECEPTOR-LIKE PROTEIN KINASE-like 2.3 isoform X5 [Quercus lobata]|uniref:LEAF RUST 10 DISEASE-RESISTANCE LOCUS RECEPTOR-LIKE PROTEIN KINASE-like 2.3 isoform X5 n=1 Tax=Quercus lobata TaxID=97700 RepID=UPI001248C05D|nr:LEAF RUST 10 DISEASE-RESISTANCE LOCUS RECEPTOR-LIKE PROTEIN KINASE-like 2.3 isoform X5 [Quercus lobata]
MVRGLPFTAGLTVVLTVLVLVHKTCSTENNTHQCAPSSCGNIQNIRYPFRLKSDPESCGNQTHELSCENNQAVLYLFEGKYYVQEINYKNYTIRLVDSVIQKDNYFSTPSYSLYRYNFSLPYLHTYTTYEQRGTKMSGWNHELSRSVVFMSCEKPVNSPLYLDTATCNYNDNSSSISDSKRRYRYVKVGETYASQVEDSCQVEKMFLTSWPVINDDPNISCTDVHHELAYGFEISWLVGICKSSCRGGIYSCYLDDANHLQCDVTNIFDLAGLGYSLLTLLAGWCVSLYNLFTGRQTLGRPFKNYLYIDYSYLSLNIVLIHVAAKMFLGAPCVVAFLTYKCRRRHLSMYNVVEEFLQSQNNLMSIRYSYPEIRKITKGFMEKLGEGGYGSVFKGKLQSGQLVAIKVLGMSKANGQDFISEVATIGRIHHANVVQLIGFCAEGPRRALIYEFMPNGSLDKYIFSQDGSISLSIEKTYKISLGVARGIEYLHRGCDMQILHFDIKPHNILLDENFTPKVFDFGLAKLYPVDDSIVALTAARGTLGYIAPELFYKNIGGVSYKADVYSFGMLLLEMANRRKNFNEFADHSSQIYFPTWVYEQVSKGNEIVMEDATAEEKKTIKKMILVALWCIQMKPSDRPSMNKVVKMLEGEECLQIPSKPFLLSLEDVRDNLNPTCSSIQSGESSQSAQFQMQTM